MPGFQTADRTGIYWSRECFVPGFTSAQAAAPAKKLALKNIARRHLRPRAAQGGHPEFQIGCKRILISNTYYPALEPDTSIWSPTRSPRSRPPGSSRRRHRPRGRRDRRRHRVPRHRSADRRAHQRQRRPQPRRHLERDGDEGLQGHDIAGFPNLFLMVGPNTGLGHTSMVFMIETQVAYILSRPAEDGSARDRQRRARSEAQQAWNDDIQRR